MAKYYVSSGDLRLAVSADTSRDAAIDAFARLSENPIQSLGKLTMVSEHGFDSEADDDCYFCTIDLLEETGQMDNFTSSEWI